MSRQNLAEAFAEARAPRYTSYPSAVQFSAQIGEAEERQWLAGLAVDEPVSLYVHVPFCRRLCWYCGCNTRAVNRPEPVTDYTTELAREIRLVSQAIGQTLAASALHLGGGSPDSLSLDDLDRLFLAIRSAFDLTPDATLAAELDPAHVSPMWIARAARHGLNRASLGVQTFSPAVQLATNRLQSFETVADIVSSLRGAGIGSINLDLMYGLPRQTTGDVLTSIEQALSLAPERLAVFGYAHVPWMKSHQRLIQTEDLPGPAERLDQAEAAAARLIAAGYVQIGLDHFALPTDEMAKAHAERRLRRNFQGYTTDQATTLIGLGASSISRLPQGFVQNHASVNMWRNEIAAGRLPAARGVAFAGDDILRGEAIERLMCEGRVDLRALCAWHGLGLDKLDSVWDWLAGFERQGLVQVSGCDVHLTEPGRPFVRTVCTAFDRYFTPEAGRHAAAV